MKLALSVNNVQPMHIPLILQTKNNGSPVRSESKTLQLAHISFSHSGQFPLLLFLLMAFS